MLITIIILGFKQIITHFKYAYNALNGGQRKCYPKGQYRETTQKQLDLLTHAKKLQSDLCFTRCPSPSQFMEDEEFVDTVKGFSTVRKEHTMFTDTNL